MKSENSIKTVESIVEKLKPIAEEVVGSGLNDIQVKAKNYFTDRIILTYEPNTVIVNLDCSRLAKRKLELAVAHELGHHVAYILNPEKFANIDIIKSRALELFFSQEIRTINEGFAYYFSLDLLPDGILQNNIVDATKIKLIRSKRNARIHHDEESVYNVGYRFFRAITKKFGKQEAFDVIKDPSMLSSELEDPKVYFINREIKQKFPQLYDMGRRLGVVNQVLERRLDLFDILETRNKLAEVLSE